MTMLIDEPEKIIFINNAVASAEKFLEELRCIENYDPSFHLQENIKVISNLVTSVRYIYSQLADGSR